MARAFDEVMSDASAAPVAVPSVSFSSRSGTLTSTSSGSNVGTNSTDSPAIDGRSAAAVPSPDSTAGVLPMASKLDDPVTNPPDPPTSASPSQRSSSAVPSAPTVTTTTTRSPTSTIPAGAAVRRQQSVSPLPVSSVSAAASKAKPRSPVSAVPATGSPSASSATIGSMTPAEAQRFGLGHLQNIGPGSSYSSPLQAFRPPMHVSQPALLPRAPTPQQGSTAKPPPSPALEVQSQQRQPTANASTPPAPATDGSASSFAPPRASAGPSAAPLQPEASSSTSADAGSTSYAAGDAARATPTNKNNPAFLNKLRSMVDDTNTDELIRWSPDGSSFFVPNHVRFGDEVLPRFFKHNRFSSFVRQLNMYGFHKVPHLQQGALKHDSPTESELWEFSNPNFHRDHPEWLARVQRKKGVRDHGEHPSEKEPVISNELTHPGSLMKNDFGLSDAEGEPGALQLTSVISAISAIKNAQHSITTDLRHLQNSNQSLWQEAIESRQRAKRQQETINKILRFLAGVFGTQDGEDGSTNAATVSGKHRSGRRVAVRPMRKEPLMIEDGRNPSNGGGQLELPLDDETFEEMPSGLRFSEDSPTATTPPESSPTYHSASHHPSSRFTALGSPPKHSAELPNIAPEATSTPGGSRRLSSQAGSSILNALTSGEGSAWLANLFGSGAANQGTNSTASTPGGGFKLDPNMVSALQQAIASGTSANEQDYFGGKDLRTDADAARFSFASPPSGTPPAANVAGKGRPRSAASAKGKGKAQQSKSQPNGAEHDTTNKMAGLSQALVRSPARPQNANLKASRAHSTSNLHYGANSGNKHLQGAAAVGSGDLSSYTADSGQQVGLPLSRMTKNIQGTSSDVDQVQNSINSLIESLRLDPGMLQVLAGGGAPHAGGTGGTHDQPETSQPGFESLVGRGYSSGGGGSDGSGTSFSAPAAAVPPPQPSASISGLSLPDASQPPSAYATLGASDTSVPSTLATNTTANPPGSGALTMDADFDVDSFLNQFVDASHAPGASPAFTTDSPATGPGVGVGGGDGDDTVFGTGLGLGGMMDDHEAMGSSPAFAFSPNTTAAFLQQDPSALSDLLRSSSDEATGSGTETAPHPTAAAQPSSSTSSSAQSTPVVGSWGIDRPASSSTASPTLALPAAARKRKPTVENPEADVEMHDAARGKKTRKSVSPRSKGVGLSSGV